MDEILPVKIPEIQILEEKEPIQNIVEDKKNEENLLDVFKKFFSKEEKLKKEVKNDNSINNDVKYDEKIELLESKLREIEKKNILDEKKYYDKNLEESLLSNGIKQEYLNFAKFEFNNNGYKLENIQEWKNKNNVLFERNVNDSFLTNFGQLKTNENPHGYTEEELKIMGRTGVKFGLK